MNFIKKLFGKKEERNFDQKREELKRLYIEGLEHDHDTTEEFVKGLTKLHKDKLCREKK